MPRITKFSHHFTVTELDPTTREACQSFLKANTKYSTRSVGWNNGRPILETFPDKEYGACSKNKLTYRFHINHLQEFMQYVGRSHHVSEFDIVDAPMYEPYKCEFKVKPKWKPREHQELLIDYIVKPKVINERVIRERAAILQTGQGKAQPLDAKIKVPGGWALMGDMKPGTMVTARDGSAVPVTAVHPQGLKKVYRITFADGRSAECCKEHLWKIYRPNRSWSEEGKIVDTEEMIRLLSLSNNRLYIDLPESEQGEDAVLPIDPYLLGVIIGDGGLTSGGARVSTPDDFIIDKISSRLPDGVKVVHDRGCDYRLSRISVSGNNSLADKLRDLNMHGLKSVAKDIPSLYLNASHKQRVALMQGLMDTDGTLGEDGSSLNYSTSSVDLAYSVQLLARSLGAHAKITSRVPKYTHNGQKLEGQLAYRVWIRAKRPSEFFSLPRKKDRANDNNQYSKTLKLRVDKIEVSRFEECQCISIDHPEHLYITDDFVVTHNTASTLFALAELKCRAILIMKGGYIKQWVNAIKDTYEDVKKGDVLVVRGSKDLVSLMHMALDNTLKAKIILISNRTFQMYIQDFLTNEHELGVYPIPAPEFMERLKIGIRVNDEVHMFFHLNFLEDLFSHVPKTLGLSATLTPDDQFMDKMYKVMFPMEHRFSGVAYIKYAYLIALHYRLKDKKGVRFKGKGMGMYSHNVFEQWLMKNKDRLANYLDIIDMVIEHEYASRRVDGERMLVFAASIEFCTFLRDRYQKKYPQLKVNRYCEADPFENVTSGDIVFSTLISSGTAIDIPGLVRVLMTTAMGSGQGNEQAFGRLRNIKTESELKFLYLTCDDIRQHRTYDERKKELFKDKALAIHDFDLHIKV